MSRTCIFFCRKTLMARVIHARLLLKKNSHTEREGHVARAAILFNSFPLKASGYRYPPYSELFSTCLQTRSSAQRKTMKNFPHICIREIPALSTWTVLLACSQPPPRRGWLIGNRRPLGTVGSKEYCGKFPEEHLGLWDHSVAVTGGRKQSIEMCKMQGCRALVFWHGFFSWTDTW